MKQPYFMNKETGEILPYEDASREFYKKPRTYLESVFDEWIETDIESEKDLKLIDFRTTIKI